MLYATIKMKSSAEPLEIDFEGYIDDSEYFMKTLGAQPVGNANRKAASVNSWHTRFLVSSNNSDALVRPPMLDCVRTHLKYAKPY
jgi:hypothetical protein